MVSDRSGARARGRRLGPRALLGLGTVFSTLALAQPAPTSNTIYTCIDALGRRLTADRPIPECVHKEQQILNRDGSMRAMVPPTLTAEELAVKEARERQAAAARAAQADAVRRDRNLVARYPNEASHNRAREAAADSMRLAIVATEVRLRELESERRPLRAEAEFYEGKALPPKLKAALDANDAAVEAQRASSANQEAEMVRITRIYDAELERLRRLWAGAPAGSLGPIALPVPARPAAVSGGKATSSPQR